MIHLLLYYWKEKKWVRKGRRGKSRLHMKWLHSVEGKRQRAGRPECYSGGGYTSLVWLSKENENISSGWFEQLLYEGQEVLPHRGRHFILPLVNYSSNCESDLRMLYWHSEHSISHSKSRHTHFFYVWSFSLKWHRTLSSWIAIKKKVITTPKSADIILWGP